MKFFAQHMPMRFVAIGILSLLALCIPATAFPALTPSNFNYNRSAYESSLNSLKTAEQAIHTALKQAGQDAHQIAKILKGK